MVCYTINIQAVVVLSSFCVEVLFSQVYLGVGAWFRTEWETAMHRFQMLPDLGQPRVVESICHAILNGTMLNSETNLTRRTAQAPKP